MTDVKKLQTLDGMLDYPDPNDASKGTTEQQFQEYLKNHYAVMYSLVAMSLWQPGTNYIKGQVILSPNLPANTIARVTTEGTSGDAEPVWGAVGSTISDGTAAYIMLPRTIDFATQAEVTAGTNTTKIVTPAMLGQTIQVDLASTERVNLNEADKSVTPGITGILPVSHGGTGTDSLANVTVGKAGTLDGDAGLWDYLHRLGKNPTLPTTNAALNALGVFMSYFDQKNKIANQPGQYGQLLNLPADKGGESAQLWIEQPNENIYHRGGNASITINDAPFKRFLDTDDLSAAGVVAGNVSNANAWWVKLGGVIPLIIQGGYKYVDKRTDVYIPFPIAYSTVLSIVGTPVVNAENGSGRGLENIKTYNTTSFVYYSGYDINYKNLLWLSVGI
nr:MAG TPA: Long-tail fiber proximal subunit PROTEIN, CAUDOVIRALES, MYOVIRIDAE [Caudoviricetes sp.]